MDTLNIGVVGLGGICKSRHVPGLRKQPDVRIAAVANRSLESSEKAAREFDIPRAFESWEEVVAHPDVDAVVIGTWPYMHHPVSMAALEAGKHVFCQARMAMNYDEAREMYEKARETGLVAMLCPVPIGLSIDDTVRRLLREGTLGEVRLVRVQSFSDAYASADKPMNWRKDHRLSGLNMLTLGMYAEVVHRWFGWTHTVAAQTSTFIPERVDPSGARVRVEIPDQILFHATLDGGIPAQYTFSAAVHHGEDRIEVYGSKMTLRYDVKADVLYGAAPDETFAPVPIKPEDAYDAENWRVEADFVKAIREGAEYHPDFEDGMRYMQVVQAVYDSAGHQAAVRLD